MPTLYEIAKPFKHAGPGGKVNKNSESIVKGLRPATAPPNPGYRILTPEQIAGLHVPVLARNNGDIKGYQREATVRHARKMAVAQARGRELPPMQISLVNGRAEVSDGQHTGLASIINRTPHPAIIKSRTEAEAKRLFADQRKAKAISKDTIVLAADGLFAEYVQEAVTSDGDHPWGDIVAEKRSSTRISPSQMERLVTGYCTGVVQVWGSDMPGDDRFDRGAADRLASLLRAFGSRSENPLAWAPVSLRAITSAAVKILRRSGERPADIERWGRVMARFPFARYAHITTSPELAKELVRHWNKRLSESRQVAV